MSKFLVIFWLGMLWGFLLGAFHVPIWLNIIVSFAAGAGLRAYAEHVTKPVRHSAKWEPIETDGWAGEPQGKEHAP